MLLKSILITIGIETMSITVGTIIFLIALQVGDHFLRFFSKRKEY